MFGTMNPDLRPSDRACRARLARLAHDSRLCFSITLEANTQPDDDVHQVDGLTIAVDRRSAPRMEGVTVDYREADGFRFLHDDEGRSLPLLTIPTLN